MSVGMVIMRPTSIVVAGAGSSASIRAAGGVEFASATSLSLNGVFTSEFDDYMIVIRSNNNTTDNDFNARLRASGTDAIGSNYVYQFVRAASTTVDAGRGTVTNFILGTSSNDQRHGFIFHLYGPNLSQPTAARSVGADALNNAQIIDLAGTHSLSTAYDGITFIAAAGSFNGQLTVFGYAQ